MRYYKWMFEDDPVIHNTPGFVFVSIDDAIRYSGEFEEWTVDFGKHKNLYTFEGVDPTPIKQFLTSHFGHRTPPYPVKKLNNQELKRTYQHFLHKPENWFMLREGDAEISHMLNIAHTVGCIKADIGGGQHVSEIEAFYAWPVDMILVEPQEIIASNMDIDQ